MCVILLFHSNVQDQHMGQCSKTKRRFYFSRKTETRKLLAGALIAKLESHLETAVPWIRRDCGTAPTPTHDVVPVKQSEGSGAATTHITALRDLYTDELQLGKLVVLIMRSHKAGRGFQCQLIHCLHDLPVVLSM